MNRSEEEKAFRRLKRIEWKLAYFDREKKWVEKQIKGINRPNIHIFYAAIISAMLYISTSLSILLSGNASLGDLLNPFFLFVILIVFLALALLYWLLLEHMEMKMVDRKRNLELLIKSLKEEKKGIFAEHPQLKDRQIRVRFPYVPFEWIELFLISCYFVLTFIRFDYYSGVLDSQLSFYFRAAYHSLVIILLIVFILDFYLRRKWFRLPPQNRERENPSPESVEDSFNVERLDILEHKRF